MSSRRRRYSTAAQRAEWAHQKAMQRMVAEEAAFIVRVIVTAEQQEALAEAGLLDDFTKEAVEDAIYKILQGFTPVVLTGRR